MCVLRIPSSASINFPRLNLIFPPIRNISGLKNNTSTWKIYEKYLTCRPEQRNALWPAEDGSEVVLFFARNLRTRHPCLTRIGAFCAPFWRSCNIYCHSAKLEQRMCSFSFESVRKFRLFCVWVQAVYYPSLYFSPSRVTPLRFFAGVLHPRELLMKNTISDYNKF